MQQAKCYQENGLKRTVSGVPFLQSNLCKSIRSTAYRESSQDTELYRPLKLAHQKSVLASSHACVRSLNEKTRDFFVPSSHG
jgi:hypothetical protein